MTTTSPEKPSIYNKMEIETIFNNCKSHDEVERVCLDFVWLINQDLQRHKQFITISSLRRFTQITKTSNYERDN